MKRALLLCLLPVLSCGAAAREEPAPPEPAPEEASYEVGELPSGAFGSIGELCAAQMDRVQGGLGGDVADEEHPPREPACDEDEGALGAARVVPGGPFLAISAVTYEAESSRRTAIVVRTRDGWFGVNPALVVNPYDDPGCPSITRDDGVKDVHVEGGRLVVIDSADRGWGEGTLLLERARACTLAANATMTCGEPVTVGVTLAKSGNEAPLFATSYVVSDDGAIVPAREWEEPEFVE
jgi:hypothetical protein